MKLYELERGTIFTIDDENNETKYLLDHIDGMYSYCTRCFDDEVCHIVAWQEVTKNNS